MKIESKWCDKCRQVTGHRIKYDESFKNFAIPDGFTCRRCELQTQVATTQSYKNVGRRTHGPWLK